MKIIYDLNEFESRTGLLGFLDFPVLDIVPTTRLGFFSRNRLPELIQYCEINPEFHIISILKRTLIRVNTAVDDAAFYMLGQGDKDPELMHVRYRNENSVYELRIREFEAD